jgi:hypothetical protein
MPITAKAVAISAQGVPVFMATFPQLSPLRRLNWRPLYFLQTVRTADQIGSMCPNGNVFGQPLLLNVIGIIRKILLSTCISAESPAMSVPDLSRVGYL